MSKVWSLIAERKVLQPRLAHAQPCFSNFAESSSNPAPQVLPSFMLEEITFRAAQRVKLVQRIMTALAKCVRLRLCETSEHVLVRVWCMA